MQPIVRLPRPADEGAPVRHPVTAPAERHEPTPHPVRPLTGDEVALLLPALLEKEFLAETKRYQKLECYGEASVDHVAARYAQTKATLLKAGVEAGRGARAFSSRAIGLAIRQPSQGTAAIHAHLRGMDILVLLEGEDAESWRRASDEVETAMRRIAPPPMTQRLPPALQQGRQENQAK